MHESFAHAFSEAARLIEEVVTTREPRELPNAMLSLADQLNGQANAARNALATPPSVGTPPAFEQVAIPRSLYDGLLWFFNLRFDRDRLLKYQIHYINELRRAGGEFTPKEPELCERAQQGAQEPLHEHSAETVASPSQQPSDPICPGCSRPIFEDRTEPSEQPSGHLRQRGCE